MTSVKFYVDDELTETLEFGCETKATIFLGFFAGVCVKNGGKLLEVSPERCVVQGDHLVYRLERA